MSSTLLPPGPNQKPGDLRQLVFFGPYGLRAAWSLILFVAMVALFVALSGWMLHPLVRKLNPTHPAGMIVIEFLLFAAVLVPTWIMSRVERRPLGVYGLPLRGAFGKTFWSGAFWGLAMLSAVMACMVGVHAYSFGSVAHSPEKLLEFGALWLCGFLFVGFFEEYCFRGYVLYTLTRGLGFWPAAIVSSLLFALAHSGNEGENWMGLAQIVLIAVVFCVSVQRTGSLWWAVGIHMSYDWGESFLFSVPNSGTHVFGHLSNASLHGSSWLSGGSVGPEASLFNFIGEAALLGIVMWMYPKPQYPNGMEVAPRPTQPETVLDLSESPTAEFSAAPSDEPPKA